ncbi:hypothetical protein [Candidatus Venteria ishoeyi]|uniref:OmpA-like domain-containing protein n=1 Tax=Candidatus Venteria ishoeyi TaxID=1899563 RepID=A0A1H6F9R3_9GAMM|nr:hypothetical protein [Candidatus Venteria ishoeyi]MDM8547491.1 hypothetical protein [Candidatus Venteria ishoeyi]SEH06832.1 Uncharacterised protein [Candidatus Venteria ishoeyi]
MHIIVRILLLFVITGLLPSWQSGLLSFHGNQFSYADTHHTRNNNIMAVANKKKIAHPGAIKKLHYQWQIHFSDDYVFLLSKQRQTLEQTLQRLKINSQDKILITSGIAPGKKGLANIQAGKLRAQHIARLIFPYTQNIIVILSQRMSGRQGIQIEHLPQVPQVK